MAGCLSFCFVQLHKSARTQIILNGNELNSLCTASNCSQVLVGCMCTEWGSKLTTAHLIWLYCGSVLSEPTEDTSRTRCPFLIKSQWRHSSVRWLILIMGIHNTSLRLCSAVAIISCFLHFGAKIIIAHLNSAKCSKCLLTFFFFFFLLQPSEERRRQAILSPRWCMKPYTHTQ